MHLFLYIFLCHRFISPVYNGMSVSCHFPVIPGTIPPAPMLYRCDINDI
ncbi:hypothetical protein MITSMUL_03876 [Mitsuokella multacida DSM 20544]|uniref:Uncharacterized protein n=1 Tax=Mitsuokella multacida DSM 20544 TaxID=500635 RepID=C9KL23_9FIRM|nr:hypothetical protein MITSMUL_03876 [Mitsuokella multacida DSM 20544]